MKKRILTLFCLVLALALVMTALAGCGKKDESPARPTSGSQTAEPSRPDQPARPEAEPAHQEGDRYEGVVTIEGMEETVRYEHIKNDALGFEMGYDYELFRRDSQPDAERFISVYDDADDPWNYLEVTRSSDSAEAAAASVGEALSQTFDIHTEERTLDGTGTCICIDASNGRGNAGTPDRMQAVYVIPAPDGCIVATAHYGFESAEGFGARFQAMLHTLTVIGG